MWRGLFRARGAGQGGAWRAGHGGGVEQGYVGLGAVRAGADRGGRWVRGDSRPRVRGAGDVVAAGQGGSYRGFPVGGDALVQASSREGGDGGVDDGACAAEAGDADDGGDETLAPPSRWGLHAAGRQVPLKEGRDKSASYAVGDRDSGSHC